MKAITKLILSAALLAGGIAAAQAQPKTAYKCTGKDGKVAFSDRPCPPGKGLSQEERKLRGNVAKAERSGKPPPPIVVVPGEPYTRPDKPGM